MPSSLEPFLLGGGDLDTIVALDDETDITVQVPKTSYLTSRGLELWSSSDRSEGQIILLYRPRYGY